MTKYPMSRRKKRATIVFAAVLTVTTAGAAFAYWSSTGSGSGEATTGETVEFTISSEEAVGTIAPGSAGQTVDFTVTNPGPGVQNLSAVTVTMATPDGTPWAPTGACSIADYSAVVTTAPAIGEMAVAASRTGTVTVKLANTAVNQDDCQGQTVPLYFTAS